MRKIDRILLKVQKARRQDNGLKLAFVSPACLLDDTTKESPNYDKWALVAHVGGSNEKPAGTLVSFYNTQEQAMQAARDMEAAFVRDGKQTSETIYVTFG